MQYQSLLEHNSAELNAILRPKVSGGWLLHRLLQDAPLDFFVLFSSASSLLSSPLIGSYAAANTFLDALAQYRVTQGQPGLSINWGLWAEVGMAAEFDGGDRTEALRGMGTIRPEQGLEALQRLLQQTSAQVGVMPVEWQQWHRYYPAFTESRLLTQLIQVEAEPSSRDDDRLTAKALLAAQPDQRQGILDSYVVKQVAGTLKLAVASLDTQETLTNLGLDSLMALELKNRIEADLGVVVPMVQLLQGPTTAQLAVLVSDKLAEAGAVEAMPASAVPATDSRPLDDRPDGENAAQLLATLDQLSDEQVDTLLNELLAEDGNKQ
jgi:acyl carrier protein